MGSKTVAKPNQTLYRVPPAERKQRIRAYNYVRRNPRARRGYPTDGRCEVCGEKRKLEGHHALGYQFYKVIQWVCRSCHRALDKDAYDARPRDANGRYVRVQRTA